MMHKTKNTILIIAAIVIVGCLLYIPGMFGLGWYRDSWNNIYNLTVRGPEMLQQAYQADRPADGFLIAILFRVFGTNLMAYQIWNLCCRILGSVFFALSLLIIWPKTSKMAGLAGLLAVSFPGFLQQVDALAYVPHQTAMFCFMLSLWLTALACTPGQKTWNVLFTFLSMLLSFASMMLMEYYVGMEIYRIALIYMMNREQAGDGKPKSVLKGLLSYIPYLIPAAGFVAWRIFIFHAERSGTDLLMDIINPLLQSPRDQGMILFVRIIKNIWKIFAGVWSVPAYTLINGLEKKAFLTALIPSLVIFAVSQIFLFLLHRKKTEDSVLDAGNESAQWLWFGLICGVISILPMVVAGRDIGFTASLDRFTWPGMIGAILFLVGLLGSLQSRELRNLLTMAAVLLSVFVQWQNQVNYMEIAKNSREYWQQLVWRAPSLEKGTTIITAGAVLAEEDYEIFAPASMIYYPGETGVAPVSAEILNENTVRDIRLGKVVYRKVREIETEKDYGHLLVISRPTSASCLQVIDGSNPIYSTSDYSKIPTIGTYSRLGQIILDPDIRTVNPFFIGEELEHGWCYYYEKMALALQMGDPETAAALADEAASKNLTAGDRVELIPVIEAYVLTGRTDDALPLAEELRKDEYLTYEAINYFSAKEDTALYADFISALKGIAPAEETDTAEPEAESTEEIEVPADTGENEEALSGEIPDTEESVDRTAADDSVDFPETEETGTDPAADSGDDTVNTESPVLDEDTLFNTDETPADRSSDPEENPLRGTGDAI